MRKKLSLGKGVFAVPYAVICVVFVVFPLILVVAFAFRDPEKGSFSFSTIADVLSNPSNYLSLLRTIGISLLATVICLLLAYPVAYILAAAPFNRIVVLALLFVVPMWMNFMLRMFALQSILNMIGISNTFWAAIIGLVYDFYPFMLLPIYTALSNLDRSYTEAAGDLGANPFTTFLRTTLPLSVPGIVSGITMVFMPCFSAYAITDVLGNPDTTIIGRKIAVLFELNEWEAGSALSLMLLVIMGIILLIGYLIRRFGKIKDNGTTTKAGGRMI